MKIWWRKVSTIHWKPAGQLSLANATKQGSSWETRSSPFSKDIHHILWHSKGSLPWSPKPITYPHPEPEENTFPSSFSNIYFNIIFSSMSISYKQSHSFTIPQRNIYSSLFFPMYVTCSANWSLLELIILTLWTGVQITKLLIAFSWAQWYFLLLGSNLTNHVVSSSQIIRIGHKRFSTELK